MKKTVNKGIKIGLNKIIKFKNYNKLKKIFYAKYQVELIQMKLVILKLCIKIKIGV